MSNEIWVDKEESRTPKMVEKETYQEWELTWCLCEGVDGSTIYNTCSLEFHFF